jgi:hypothetical protein
MHIEENIRGKLRMAEMFEMMASVPPLRNENKIQNNLGRFSLRMKTKGFLTLKY